MRNGRLEFLDALRGVAALTVAVQHLAEVIWPGVLEFSHIWWRPGEFGVLVFFICSGFIIPASMERRGDLKEFWIGRAFRLFPLYLAVLGIGLLLYATPWAAPAPGYRVVSDTLLNTTMLQVFANRPLVIGASWTLGYEMVFYLTMTVLFMLGWHRRSAGISMGLMVSALVLGSTLVPAYLQQTQIRSWPAVVFGLIALAVVVIAPRLKSGAERSVGLTITVAVLLLMLNRPHDLWFAMLLLGSMFVGTALYRYDIGQLSGRTAAGVFSFAFVSIIVVQFCYHVGAAEPITGAVPRWWTEALTFCSAYAVFGVLFLLRRFSYPRVFVYLGTISYSVYLGHALVLMLPLPSVAPLLLFAGMVGFTLLLAAVTYHGIEKPGQLVGRKVISRYRARSGGTATVPPGATPGGPVISEAAAAPTLRTDALGVAPVDERTSELSHPVSRI
ncbi:acyltransferase family protein [Modestobacter sp. VKM Ac-2984]|uniref:acyltransferase family protein n=1 Tax=Modestobacter sp. VKM Ac-2984 TaxID=3004138 RepID=UPI0022AA72CE|nr:acyltransferase [Modestobacter sp. VKM Ac-2984]MCZ2816402.1 acyltransferase [Modestobacter sp. VKM Ac-2984]